MELVNFWAAVDRLGPTEADKARALGISERQFRNWKRSIPIAVRRIVAQPDVAEALAADAVATGVRETQKAS